jgi:hypothetical protein
MLTGFDGTGSATAGESAQDFMAITAGHPMPRVAGAVVENRRLDHQRLPCVSAFSRLPYGKSRPARAGTNRGKDTPFERLLLPWCQRSKPACHQRCTLQPLMRPRSVGADRRAHVVSRGHGKGLEWAQS